MIMFTIQNVACPNFYKSLVNSIFVKKRCMYINMRMNKWYTIKINTAFSKKIYLASSDRKQMHYTYVENCIKAQNMLRVVI